MSRESEIEAEIVAYAKARGWWTTKYVSPGRRGVPDRIFARNGWVEIQSNRVPQVRVVFIEVKKVGERPTVQQEKVHRDMREQGLEVYWTDNLEDAKRWLK